MEYRMNLTDERTPFNIIIAKGVRTGVQLALFAERGTVFDSWADQWKNMKTTYGAGLRVMLSGVIIRLDGSYGNEGSTLIVFINNPWSMFSVDSPG